MLKLHLKKKQQKEVTRITEYLVTGGAYFWSGYFIIVFSEPIIGLWWANIIGNTVGVTVNFLLSRYWVFSSSKDKQVARVTYKYLVLTLINFYLNFLILSSLQNIGVHIAIGQFIAAGFFTIWNYIWYSLWVFTKGQPGHKHQSAPVLHRPKHVRPPIKRRKK
ncbi:MAG: GtrA family protein [Patescibacteria group bacterium]|jgi:putative flippase GtrA